MPPALRLLADLDRASPPDPPRIAFSYSKSAPRLDAAVESSADILEPAFWAADDGGLRTTFSANKSLIMPCVVSGFGGVVVVVIDVALICRELSKLLIEVSPSCGRRKRPLRRPN